MANTNDGAAEWGVKYKQSRFMDDAVISATSLGSAPGQLISNVARSGQLGIGIRTTKLDGATPVVFNPVVALVLQVPSMWDRYPKRQETLRALMETHAKSISGIDFGYELATEETPVGHDGQTMKVPTRTTRSQVNPSATFTEYVGCPVYRLFRTWMFDIQHPDTNASALPNWIDDNAQIPAWCMSAYSMSMLFIQYDPTGLPDRIEDAFTIINMFPTSIGEMGFERNIGTTKILERSISFTGIVQHNENTIALGRAMAETLRLHKINYQFALPGLNGTISPDDAVQKELQLMGGINYEAGTGHAPVKGAIDQFKYLGSNTQAYEEVKDGGGAIPATGANTVETETR